MWAGLRRTALGRALLSPTVPPLAPLLLLALAARQALRIEELQAGAGRGGGGTTSGLDGYWAPDLRPLEYGAEQGALSTALQIAKWPFDRNWAHLTYDCRGKDCGVERFLIEVGANRRDVLQDEYPLAASKAFVLTFEPLLDKYAWLLQRHTEQDRISPPGRQHRRGLALPMAVGCAGRATFHVPDIDGCASVLPPTGTKELLAAQRTAVAQGGPKWKRMVSDLCAEARPPPHPRPNALRRRAAQAAEGLGPCCLLQT